MKYATVMCLIVLAGGSAYWWHAIDNKESDGAQARVSGALRALDFWAESRAYPETSLPDNAHYAAFKAEGAKKGDALQVDIEPWKSLGPKNIGGRTLALAFNPHNPQTVYAGSASGGLWRSYSGGEGAEAWHRVPTPGLPVLSVSSIVVDPADTNTLYIGTGEVYAHQRMNAGVNIRITRGTYGLGILKSTDGGASWEMSLDWTQEQGRGIQALKQDPADKAVLWAASSEGTYKSTNAGAIWAKVHEAPMANDIAIDANDTKRVLVTAGNFYSDGYGIYRTPDGGNTWEKLENGLPGAFGGKAQLAVHAANPAIVFASIGNGHNQGSGTWLCRTDDFGDTWTVVSTVDYAAWQGWFSHDVAVHPSDPDIVYTCGINIWQSIDGGKNLAQISIKDSAYFGVQVPPGGAEGSPEFVHADLHDIVFHPNDPNTIYFATDGGIYKTSDGGLNFRGCNGGYQTSQFYNGFSSSRRDSNFAMGGLQDNHTLIYEGGPAWRKEIGGDGAWTAIDARNDSVVYGSAQFLLVAKSTTRGAVPWNVLPIPQSAITNFIAPFVVATDNPDIIYAGRDVVFKSVDGGANFTATNNGLPLDGNPALSMAISEQNSNVLYVATSAEPYVRQQRPGVFRTTSGGFTWQNITGSLPDRYPLDMAVDPNNDEIVYIALGGFGSPHVFKSGNGGMQWENISSNLPDVPTSAIAIDPDRPDYLYIGNDLGVYFSSSGGRKWTQINNGIAETFIVRELNISLPNRAVRVATHGYGAYERPLFESEVVSVNERKDMTASTRMDAQPNPTEGDTRIAFHLESPAKVDLEIVGMDGKLVARLLSRKFRNAGEHSVAWNARDRHGRKVAAGAYLCRLTVNGQSASTTIIVR